MQMKYTKLIRFICSDTVSFILFCKEAAISLLKLSLQVAQIWKLSSTLRKYRERIKKLQQVV